MGFGRIDSEKRGTRPLPCLSMLARMADELLKVISLERQNPFIFGVRDLRTHRNFPQSLFRSSGKYVPETSTRSHQQFKRDSKHPSLQSVKVHSSKPIYSVRVSLGYRAVGMKGNHESFGSGLIPRRLRTIVGKAKK